VNCTKVVWNEKNEEVFRAKGISKELAEAIIFAQNSFVIKGNSGKYVFESTVLGCHYRLLASITNHGHLYPETASQVQTRILREELT